jgi:hypothetical protein
MRTPPRSNVQRLILLILASSLLPAYAYGEDAVFTFDFREGKSRVCEDVMISVDPRLAKHNLGGMEIIGVWQFDGISLIRFKLDRIPKQSVVTKAVLKLYCNSAGFTPTEIARDWPIDAHVFEEAWDEGTGTDKEVSLDGATITTSTRKDPWLKGSPTGSIGPRLGTIVQKGGTPQWYEWNLEPKLVNEWIAGKRPNHGLALVGKPPGKAVSFVSSESPELELRPQLQVTVTVPLEKLVKQLLGEGDKTRVRKVATYHNPVNDRITINVSWSLDVSGSRVQQAKGAIEDVTKFLRFAHSMGPALSHINLRGFYGTADGFEKGGGIIYVNTEYTRKTLAEIDWKTIEPWEVLFRGDSVELHENIGSVVMKASDELQANK